ncbi:4Fe-4S ferredoxin [Candidatus Thorarchaeota archaeon]|nr:MAG: 4Fe-4S ferredoxin [Candidatus Thorarchaeota archaeon]
MNQDDIEYLMRINVGDHRMREKGRVLLLGSCMMSRYPQIVDEFRAKDGGQAALEVCLEETHVNQAGFKIGSIVRYSDIKRLTALTVDGSPHCVQLHYVIEDVKRHFTPEVELEHYVVERGEVHEISSEAVKRSRHLSKIQSMLDSETG